jgi:iron complex transport system ATP-binding protein
MNLSLAAGEVVALLGPNGSGKSTFLRCLLGQLRGAGEIRWDGKPLADWSPRGLARHVAYMAQSLLVDSDSRVGDVLRMGRAPYLQAFGIESTRDIEVVREVAQTLGLADLIRRPMDQLSGGQRQRVFLGRCLVQEPAVLLLDEPNTYLDLRHQVELGTLLRDLARTKNLAVLMASHDLNLSAQFAHRLILLEEGAVAADGPPNDVLRADLLSRVYGIAMERVDHDGTAHVFPSIHLPE